MRIIATCLLLVSVVFLFPACSKSRSILLKTKDGESELFESLEIDSSIFSSSKITFSTNVGLKEFPKSFNGIRTISVVDNEELIKKLEEERKREYVKLMNSNKDPRKTKQEIDKEYNDLILGIKAMRGVPIIQVTYKSSYETYTGPCRDLKGTSLIGYTKTGKHTIPFSMVSEIVF